MPRPSLTHRLHQSTSRGLGSLALWQTRNHFSSTSGTGKEADESVIALRTVEGAPKGTRKRFVPPWEREGKTADDFFAGIFESKNTMVQKKKEKSREEKMEEERLTYSEELSERENERIREALQLAEDAKERERNFLPLGARPLAFLETDKMAAWGVYVNQLREYQLQVLQDEALQKHEAVMRQAQSGDAHSNSNHSEAVPDLPSAPFSLSEETKLLLEGDMHRKIPYRWTTYRPPTVQKDNTPSAPAVHRLQHKWPLYGSAALVIDVEGVLFRGGQLVPGSDEAVQVLNELKIPFLLLFNHNSVPLDALAPIMDFSTSTAKDEQSSPAQPFVSAQERKARQLSLLLKTDIKAEQILFSYSPMSLLAPLYADKNVLVVGNNNQPSNHWKRIAQQDLGFNRVFDLNDMQCLNAEWVPLKNWGKYTPVPHSRNPNHCKAHAEISAILQFCEPDDAFNDAQLLLDVLLSPRGKVSYDSRAQPYICREQQIPYYYSNDDFFITTDCALPRLGPGAFRDMLSTLYESMTGDYLSCVVYSQPRQIFYAYAERQLKQLMESAYNPHFYGSHRGQTQNVEKQLQTIFMVGEGAETAVMGANARGGRWCSVQVLSGSASPPLKRRKIIKNDEEQLFFEKHAGPDSASELKTPAYIAPTLDHFVRELLALPKEVVLENQRRYFGEPLVVHLHDVYNF